MNKIIKARADIALLITRLIVGGIFISAGWSKISDINMTIGFFSKMQIPAFLAYIVSYGEFIGGILIVLGLWTALAASFLAIVMIVAIYLVRAAGVQGFGLPLATLSGVISILGCGAGKYAVRFPKRVNNQTSNPV